jgi:hypothetical protein
MLAAEWQLLPPFTLIKGDLPLLGPLFQDLNHVTMSRSSNIESVEYACHISPRRSGIIPPPPRLFAP